ncbi:MAG: aminomethyl-transferring glycine dehydrogenase subunit GcvPA [Candidatus Omnitrophica bacterium]|nr:putative glycine dehydrogenase (decarboxylating) subunit 1 [bacterium]NUN96164.1 aminomethyl-transferring glycine dehydrogenase subunit GcvPA [Candidatus Omnitrophota bacterium]
MPYTPHTEADTRRMLEAIGLPDIDSLFAEIPAGIRNPNLDLAPALSEAELREEIGALARLNGTVQDRLSFLGGGAYERIRPSLVDRLISRAEFCTSYTPYQAEVSQGTLQYVFEFQSLITRLTGMEVANASMYDGASSLAEAALMAMRITRKSRVLFAGTLHPRWKETLRSYLAGMHAELVEIPERNGVLDGDSIHANLNPETAALLVQHPNFFGYLEDLEMIGGAVQACGALWIQASDPVSLGLLKSPGEWGADIAVGELQSLGMPLSFGGPYAGYFACKQKFVRQMPGRIVGKTLDAEGKTGYVLTLQTREQHIRREKATSNICTNQSLCALAATLYLAALGGDGFREVACRNADNAHYLAEGLRQIRGLRSLSANPFFNEFTLVLDRPASDVAARLKAKGILPGIHDSRWTGAENRLVVCATETKKKQDLDRFIEAFSEVMAG